MSDIDNLSWIEAITEAIQGKINVVHLLEHSKIDPLAIKMNHSINAKKISLVNTNARDNCEILISILVQL